MADEFDTGSEHSLRADRTVETVCPIEMGLHLMCERPLHNAQEGSDERPVCLMHSKDPNKERGELSEAFWREFEVILEAAGENAAHFEFFWFPGFRFKQRSFEAICRFDYATFMHEATFYRSIFTKRAYFRAAEFTQLAKFDDTTFLQGADFSLAKFSTVTLEYTTFTESAIFFNATFSQKAFFERATFSQRVAFKNARFRRNANFERATFGGEADFDYTIFAKSACFRFSTFAGDAHFEETEFLGMASWEACRFLESAAFRRTKFNRKNAGRPNAGFAWASLSDPRKIIFEDVDLSRVLFHNCDVSEVWFTSSVRWATRGGHGVGIFEESVPLSGAEGLQRDGERDYRAIAQIYQQLKKNYDSRLDYWTANEFHFGEMEMKRLATPTEGHLLWLRRWMHRWLSLTAWYRYASDYGNSYQKPMLWLLAMLLLFALLFPLPGVGLRQTGTSYTETYSSVWHAGAPLKKSIQWVIGLLGKSMLVAVDTATFQRNPEYAPAYPWGRVLAIAETLLTSTLFGLFLLAIRRQFRR